MPKKRTVVPYYGKINQRLEQRAKVLTEIGTEENIKKATALRKQSDAIIARRSGK